MSFITKPVSSEQQKKKKLFVCSKYWNGSIDFDREKKFNFYISELENPSSNYNYSENNFRHNTGYVKSGIVISL